MPDYTLIEIDAAGERRAEAFTAPNDEEAVRRAICATEASVVEVWRDGLKIRSLHTFNA